MPRLTPRRFFRTPKGLVIIAMTGLLVVAAAGQAGGPLTVAPLVLASVVAAMLVDAPIVRWRDGEWLFPDGALLTGMFVAMILSSHERWTVGAITAVVAVLSKYVLRTERANVFNPAAFALVATFYIFNTGQSWWGALPELPIAFIVLLIAIGLFIAQRVNKMPAVLSFLGVYFALFTLVAFVGDPAPVAALYRQPDLHGALFFAFFMVTDPPTSPPKHREQLIFGALTAVMSFLAFKLIGAAYFLLAGLLIANAWEAVRRVRARRLRVG
jgi:Na+-translocating ferredoxin:NAD+ oxidoreductase RnfD subunit